jgi:hypothetical protein
MINQNVMLSSIMIRFKTSIFKIWYFIEFFKSYETITYSTYKALKAGLISYHKRK